MDKDNCIDLSTLEAEAAPFPYCYDTQVLLGGMDLLVYEWLSQTDLWRITHADFYDQYEFSLWDVALPQALQALQSQATVAAITAKFREVFHLSDIQLVGITAHKLVDGQRIAIHNDYIEGEETHRLVIHFNPNWSEENGGLFMIFASPQVEDLSKVILPIHNSAIGFEISRRSHHAVSTIHGLTRYSIVYTFKAS
jgi:Rps23 Pro-64 3,4-dihydroxylase Tpa1-like proline 4-hydroxylase